MADVHEPADRYAKPGSGNDPQFASLRDAFVRVFGEDDSDGNPLNDAPIHVVRAPGRVNLIGEHTDYSEGFVFPMAIEPRITFAFRRRNDKQIRVASDQDTDGSVTTFTTDTETGEPKWTNYLRGPVALLRERGELLVGAELYLMSSLPVGAGLSSSAALEVGTTRAMLHLTGGTMTDAEVALMCQRAEQEYAGMPCGIMDQMIVASGMADHAMLLDCRSLEATHVPLPSEHVALVICDSKVEHELTDGGFAERVESCKQASAKLGVPFLRDATTDQVEANKDALGDLLYRRARHVVAENERCLAFAEALRSGDYASAGERMYESHASLRDDYEVSTPELDGLVEAARGIDGVFGSRMTGGGFGGCTVTLCHPDAADAVRDGLAKAAKELFGVDTLPFVTAATVGAQVVD
ncbi:MAG: galactokinase [Planctomycetota bacterium]